MAIQAARRGAVAAAARRRSTGGGVATPAAAGSPGIAEKDSTSTAADITANMPTGVGSGEVLVASVSGSQALTPTMTGWTLIPNANPTESSGPISQTGFYRVAAASEPTTYVVTGVGAGRAAVLIQRYVNVSTSSPIAAGATKLTTAEDAITADTVAASLELPSVTTPVANCLLVSACTLNSATSSTLTPPSGMTQAAVTTGTGRRQMQAYQLQAGTGPSGAKTWARTGTSNLQFAGWLVALRPS